MKELLDSLIKEAFDLDDVDYTIQVRKTMVDGDYKSNLLFVVSGMLGISTEKVFEALPKMEGYTLEHSDGYLNIFLPMEWHYEKIKSTKFEGRIKERAEFICRALSFDSEKRPLTDDALINLARNLSLGIGGAEDMFLRYEGSINYREISLELKGEIFQLAILIDT